MYTIYFLSKTIDSVNLYIFLSITTYCYHYHNCIYECESG